MPPRFAEIREPTHSAAALSSASLPCSAAASALICWLVYFHAPTDVGGHAAAVAAAGECGAECCWRPSRWSRASAKSCIAASCTIARRCLPRSSSRRSSWFPTWSNFTLHGETHFNRFNHWWPFLLEAAGVAHCAVDRRAAADPDYVFPSLTGRFPAHKKIARWTFPIWLYVSVTGVVVYLMQAACR